MKRLSIKLANRWTHEVACWLEYERSTKGIRKGAWHVNRYLGGACHIAAFILRRVLTIHGYVAGVVYDAYNGHAFVTTACGLTLDPTQGQFAVQYGFSPDVGVERYSIMRADHGFVPRAMLWSPGKKQHPSWPGYHRKLMMRILRRMGVEELE